MIGGQADREEIIKVALYLKKSQRSYSRPPPAPVRIFIYFESYKRSLSRNRTMNATLL